MKIYTYYQDVSFNNQEELIDLWSLSWYKQGFDPIILGEEHAKEHPLYEQFIEKINSFSRELLVEISIYDLNCFVRWLAYATQLEEKFYVSDYDAINSSFPPIEPDDKLHLMTGHVPFLASGTPKQFENLCKLFMEITEQKILEILNKLEEHQSNVRIYSDQRFFLYNKSNLLARDDIKISNNIDVGHMFDPNKNCAVNHNCIEFYPKEQCKVYHVSYKNATYLKENYNQYSDVTPHKLKSIIADGIIKIC
jgi:hypothetical protein